MATRMTRKEYEASYGVVPVFTESKIDTTPAPIRMTQEEYNTKYRQETPKSGFLATVSGIPSDIRSGLSRGLDNLRIGQAKATEAGEQAASGEISKGTAIFKGIAGSAVGATRASGDVALGLAKTFFSPAQEESIGEKVGEVGRIVVDKFKEEYDTKKAELAASINTNERQVATQLEGFEEQYKTDPNFKAKIDAGGNAIEVFADLAGLKIGGKAVSAGIDVAPDLNIKLPKFDEVSRTSRKVTSLETGLSKLEDGYSNLRKANEFTQDGGIDIRRRIVESDVLVGAVDTNGVIRTKGVGGPIEIYRKANIGGLENVVRDNLIREGKTISVQEVEKALRVAVSQSRLEGADLVTAMNGIKREITGLTHRADALGRIELAKVHDAKISETNNINFSTPPETATYRKTKARVYKTLIEDTSGFNVKEVNSELGKQLAVIKRLELLDGKRVQGGRLGKAFAQLSGQLIGGAAGSVAGPAGAAIGGLLGGEGARVLKGAGMSRSFGKGLGLDAKGNPILEKAKDAATGKPGRSLKTADGKISAPSSVNKTPEMRVVEKDIARNVDSQKKAIKAGDFTLVSTLKDVYDVLVERLIELIQDTQIGLSIKKSVTPLSVAKKMDVDDVDQIRLFLDDPQASLLDDGIQRLIEDTGLSKADEATQVAFFKEALSEVTQLEDAGKHPLIKEG